LTSASVALVRSKFPDMSAREVVQRIIASARDSGPQPGKDLATGYGAIRPYHALVDNVPKNAPNPVFATYDQWKKSQPAANTSGGTSAPAAVENKGSGSNMMLLPGAAVIVVLGAIIFGLILLRSRGRRAPAMPYAQSGQPPYQQGGPPYQQGMGTPPSFGAPPGGAGRYAGPPAPYPAQQSDPPQGARPGLQPPQGPPGGAGPEQAARQPGAKVWPPSGDSRN
jgi:hypothetical protein